MNNVFNKNTVLLFQANTKYPLIYNKKIKYIL